VKFVFVPKRLLLEHKLAFFLLLLLLDFSDC